MYITMVRQREEHSMKWWFCSETNATEMYPRSFDDVKWCLYEDSKDRYLRRCVIIGEKKKKDGFENDLDYFQGDRIKDWTIVKNNLIFKLTIQYNNYIPNFRNSKRFSVIRNDHIWNGIKIIISIAQVTIRHVIQIKFIVKFFIKREHYKYFAKWNFIKKKKKKWEEIS